MHKSSAIKGLNSTPDRDQGDLVCVLRPGSWFFLTTRKEPRPGRAAAPSLFQVCLEGRALAASEGRRRPPGGLLSGRELGWSLPEPHGRPRPTSSPAGVRRIDRTKGGSPLPSPQRPNLGGGSRQERKGGAQVPSRDTHLQRAGRRRRARPGRPTGRGRGGRGSDPPSRPDPSRGRTTKRRRRQQQHHVEEPPPFSLPSSLPLL